MALRDEDSLTHDEFLKEKERRRLVREERKVSTQSNGFNVYYGGPKAKPKVGEQGSHGWNIGDIDFDPDGSIFIRNPYLADAIERCIAKNYDDLVKKGGRTVVNGGELFRLTRDEGWSGEKQNIVC